MALSLESFDSCGLSLCLNADHSLVFAISTL